MSLVIFAAGLFAFGVVGVVTMSADRAAQTASVLLWTGGGLACLVALLVAGPVVALLLAAVLLLVKLACR